jgi:hypothetical protein
MIIYGEYGMFEFADPVVLDHVSGAYGVVTNGMCVHPASQYQCIQANGTCSGAETNGGCPATLDAQCTGVQSNSGCTAAVNGTCLGNVNALCPTNAVC